MFNKFSFNSSGACGLSCLEIYWWTFYSAHLNGFIRPRHGKPLTFLGMITNHDFFLVLTDLKVNICHQVRVAHVAGTYLGFCSIKRLGILIYCYHRPLSWMGWDAQSATSSSCPKDPPSGTFLYSWMERGTMKTFVGREKDCTTNPKNVCMGG